MLRYRHDMRNIPKDTAKALLGKKAFMVDAFESVLGDRTFDYSLTVYEQSEGYICRIACYTNSENLEFERFVTVYINGRHSNTEAAKCIYDKGKSIPKDTYTFYKDWTVPSEKKFREILYKTF